ncbi:Gfo/Idh/MocA family protein [Labrys wisconsinensis]|uniref:Dehydrogenase n=1 Tax=Labrys wisconsinensis TaxID=425677 RepID=A0ABU0J0A3_9HYPH|nr:Gfo/Idh/MocA family oxidoreductase [Labrys wisconsinensis]MDQ0467691.1 putative dehydrogenase [Labrys wisconsinensis]
MTAPLRVAVIGAGYIGRRHADWLAAHPGCVVAGIADPADAAREHCAARGIPWFADFRDLIGRADAAVVAAPNALHLAVGLACLEHGLPVLVEKPLADTAAAATAFAAAARRSGVPVLVGFYRRHGAVLQEARRRIAAGDLGRIVTASLRLVFLKPDVYFEPAWRRSPGGGPLLINAIHDIDALRYLLGEMTGVQAVLANAARGFAVEDSGAILMTFESGAIATAILSDSVASPYSWDINAAEDSVYPAYGKDVYLIGGTAASLALPELRRWSYPGERGWTQPLAEETLPVAPVDPYRAQCAHFIRVARGEEAPAVTAEDAARTQIVAEAIREAAETGRRIDLAPRFAALDDALAA